VLPILLVSAVLARSGGLGANLLEGHPQWSLLAATAPIILVLAAAFTLTQLSLRRMNAAKYRTYLRAERIVRSLRWAALLNHAVAVLLLGWLDAVRHWLGDVVALDELVAILPPVAALLGSWWIFHPVERRMREELDIRRLSRAQPVYAMPTRGQYVMLQARLHLFLMLVPILLILAVSETIELGIRRFGDSSWPMWITDIATFAGALTVFLLAPLLARVMLSVSSLPHGELRDHLINVCRRHRVRVRDLLLWNTHGTMINAAVMGISGGLRYVLVTDALLDTMTRPQVEAVMAHEVGHVRRHHMPWLALALLSVIFACALLLEVPLLALHVAHVELPPEAAQWIGLAGTAAVMLASLLVFGWICRRFERQADTFAVQDLSRKDSLASIDADHSESPSGERVTSEAVVAMAGALDTIAHLNGIDPDRPSWRHGSIAWRRRYLLSLVDRPIESLPIDRLIRRIKLGTLMLLLAGVAGAILIESLYSTLASQDDAAGVRAGPAQERQDAAGLRARPSQERQDAAGTTAGIDAVQPAHRSNR
jgi:Zn-dependent protease with chaperone function